MFTWIKNWFFGTTEVNSQITDAVTEVKKNTRRRAATEKLADKVKAPKAPKTPKVPATKKPRNTKKAK